MPDSAPGAKAVFEKFRRKKGERFLFLRRRYLSLTSRGCDWALGTGDRTPAHTRGSGTPPPSHTKYYPNYHLHSGLRIRSRIRSDPDLFGRIRIRILSVLWQCKVVYTRKKYFKNRGFTHFQVNFSIFSDKNYHHSNIRRNMFDVKKILMFELIL